MAPPHWGSPLNVRFANGFVPAVGAQFQILACGSLTSAFTVTNMPAGIAVAYSGSGVFRTVTSAVSAVSITSQPASQTVAVGARTFAVTAAGAGPITYQWQFNGANLTDNGRVIGSAGSVLTLTNALLTDAGNYQVIVANALAGQSSAAMPASRCPVACPRPPDWFPGGRRTGMRGT